METAEELVGTRLDFDGREGERKTEEEDKVLNKVRCASKSLLNYMDIIVGGGKTMHVVVAKNCASV